MQGKRWSQAREAIAELAAIASEYDANGIDIHFLNSDHQGKGLKSAKKVRDVFNKVSPKYSTPLGPVVREVLAAYKDQLVDGKKRKKTIKPVNYLVITDGRPDDEQDLEDAIVKFAHWLDREEYPPTQVGIQFVQVGNDSEASEYLQKLDNNLSPKKGIRDIVDTERYNGDVTAAKLIKLMIGGINRRVDIKGGEVMMQH
ncbi:hypothetical protein CONPUDRAFT_130975 [Coniophora puteana RWD-64-598 SS2]|uniref:VWFA domain-containing protein n=1 Tax=Coniophora puteana (strain RWD-64-598) TaxID=741705 RepID=A0A5M3MAS4_CONPW|nr:uncharacterized protein CONPUDRAFT_130975 [Coniophora puteana RWD-64-598 SS2]EIW76378.1 hypothetical protein CONPUDRAFT_130975 [Coniophora puteana RWD-64-598 SS2]